MKIRWVKLIMIFCILGLMSDIYYYCLRGKCSCIDGIILNLCYVFRLFHVTYHSAFKILTNYIGIIVTVVSLILSTYINILQRLEKNSFGITYREMQEVEKGIKKHVLRCSRWVTYIAPIMLVLVLNLRLCITGYMLYFFCWFFAFLEFCLYIESFTKEAVPEKVVEVILKSLPSIEDWEDKDVLKLDKRLIEMMLSVKKEGNWSEVELIFKAFLKKMVDYNAVKRALLSEHFLGCLCREQNNNPMLIYSIWNLSLFVFNQKEYLEEKENNEYAYLWGMLRGILPSVQVEDICKLIDDMLDVRRQGIEVCKAATEKSQETLQLEKQCSRLDIQKVKIRSAMLLVLLEDMFQSNYLVTKQIAKRIFCLKKYGDEIFDTVNSSDLEYIINSFVKDVHEQKRLDDIIYRLHMDKQNHFHRCYVNRCVDIL